MESQAKAMVENYTAELMRWRQKGRPKKLDKFLRVDEAVLKWVRHTKKTLLRGQELQFDPTKIRVGLYRPFCKMYYYFEAAFNEDLYHLPVFFPNEQAEKENRVICVNQTQERPFAALVTDKIPNLVMAGGFGCSTQCFPFYTYDADDGTRWENIPPSMLTNFQTHYTDKTINRWDIFHYIYAVLHHPEYRSRYAANLRRELPRIPILGGKDAKVFRACAEIGRQLVDLHVHYEKAVEYPLQRFENPEEKLNWRVEKMRLGKDKTQIVYNEFLTLAGVPDGALAYRIGNRSAIEWVIDQYQVTTDARSGITNDPNRDDEPDYIVKLIGRVITVSLETQKQIGKLPPLSR
jgi:predicted helicase